jgi:transposase
MCCPRCQSDNTVKAGFQSGKQRLKCKTCNRLFVPRSERGKPDEVKAKAIALYLESVGFRAIGRLLDVSNVAVLKWVRKAAESLPAPKMMATVDVLEMDELWHFIQKKAANSGYGLLLTVSETKSLTSRWAVVVQKR